MSYLANIAQPQAPSPEEIQIAIQSYKALTQYTHSTQSDITLRISQDNQTDILIPASASRLLIDILSQMAEGHAVSVTAFEEELSTQAAATLLNISRPFLVDLLERGSIPFRKVGTQRRVLMKDLIEFKGTTTAQRMKSLQTLTNQAQKLNMGY